MHIVVLGAGVIGVTTAWYLAEAGHQVTVIEKNTSAGHGTKGLFPKVPDAAIASAERWSGLRPVTPDGPPRIGACRYPNLYLNSGHGTLGWTMACGSGKALADQISGKRSDVDLTPFAPH